MTIPTPPIPAAPTPAETIAQLLGTADPAQQVEQISFYLRRASAMPLPITVIFDPLTGTASVPTMEGIEKELVLVALGAAIKDLSTSMLRDRAPAAQAAQAAQPGAEGKKE